jgi:hypothetical protein
MNMSDNNTPVEEPIIRVAAVDTAVDTPMRYIDVLLCINPAERFSEIDTVVRVIEHSLILYVALNEAYEFIGELVRTGEIPSNAKAMHEQIDNALDLGPY